MALEDHLQTLKDIKGYMASGIMSFTGEMFAHDSSDADFDLALVGATFNDIFRSAEEASTKIGLDYADEMTIETPRGDILMFSSGPNAKIRFHLIGVLSQDGNKALMNMQMKKLVAPIEAELS